MSFLTPLALEDDEFTYIWEPGSKISYSKVHNLIHKVDPGITDVPLLELNGSASSLQSGNNALPTTTATSITVSIVQAS